jgi:uncharacterized protein
LIFIDSNIPMYIIGAEHPNKTIILSFLEALTRNSEYLVTSAEVFQEILHRYTAIKHKEAIQPAWECLESICDQVLPVTYECVNEAKRFLLSYKKISSRDALHLSTMKLNKVTKILSFDTGFDQISGIERIPK